MNNSMMTKEEREAARLEDERARDEEIAESYRLSPDAIGQDGQNWDNNPDYIAWKKSTLR
jgi:hypothetical protein